MQTKRTSIYAMTSLNLQNIKSLLYDHIRRFIAIITRFTLFICTNFLNTLRLISCNELNSLYTYRQKKDRLVGSLVNPLDSLPRNPKLKPMALRKGVVNIMLIIIANIVPIAPRPNQTAIVGYSKNCGLQHAGRPASLFVAGKQALLVRGLTRPTLHPPSTNKRNYVFLIVFYVLFNIRCLNTE